MSYDWKPFEVQFRSADGVFSFRVYAISHEHAELIVQDIKDTANVFGEIIEEQDL